MDERNFWIFSGEEIVLYEKLQEDSAEIKSKVFHQGGQIVLRKGKGTEEEVLSLDAGPFGYLSIAAHAHADALSFCLSLGGKPVLIDPGTYLYHDGGKWRDYFRGTRAHNTIEIDGLDQGLSGGPFMWLSKPEMTIKEVFIGPDRSFVQAFHKGYERLSFPLIHERYVAWNHHERSWLIEDRLETQGFHRLLLSFHFHPHCQVQSSEAGLFKISLDEPVLYLKLDPRLQPSLLRGKEDPIRGWYSASFGEKIPTFTLIGEMTIQKTDTIQTFLWRA